MFANVYKCLACFPDYSPPSPAPVCTCGDSVCKCLQMCTNEYSKKSLFYCKFYLQMYGIMLYYFTTFA